MMKRLLGIVHTLVFQLWLGMMALVFIAMTVLVGMQVLWIEPSRQAAQIQAVEQIITGQLSLRKPDTDAKAFAELADSLGGAFYVYDREGKLIESGGHTSGASRWSNEMREIAMSAQDGATIHQTLISPTFQTAYYIVAVGQSNVAGEGAQSRSVVVAYPVRPTIFLDKVARRQLWEAAFALTLAAAALAGLIARLYSLPILSLDSAARRLAEGDLVVTISTRRRDELGDLARTIHRLSVSLRSAETLKSELIANVSHELRTPLALIRGYAEILDGGSYLDDERRKQQLGIIISESERLSRTVDDLLAFSKLRAGEQNLRREPVNLAELTEHTVKTYSLPIEQFKLNVSVDIENPEAFVSADPIKIMQVLSNLMDNAVNHTPECGWIRIAVESRGGDITVRMTNSGEAIPSDVLPHIWDRYRQALRGGQKRMGTGLGLAIVHAILTAHGAKFGADSSEGETAFWFSMRAIAQV